MRRAVGAYACLCILFLLHACAFDVVRVKQTPTQFEASSQSKKAFELDNEVTVRLDTGYTRLLKKGTRWACIGTTPEGDVFRTKDQVLTIEGSNMHEADIVVKAQNLVGFYLPVERTFSPLSSQLALPVKDIINNP